MAKRAPKVDLRQGWLKLPITGGTSVVPKEARPELVGERVSRTQIVENIMKKPIYSDYTKKR